MADYNKPFAKEQKQWPNQTVASFTSNQGSDKFLVLDIYRNQAQMVFTDVTNKDNIINIRFTLPIDRMYALREFIKTLVVGRKREFLEGKPYSSIPEESAYKILMMKNGPKAIPGQEPYLKIYTTNVDGAERITLKAWEDGRIVEIILMSKYVETVVSDPNRLANIDLQDITLMRLSHTLETIMPLSLVIYKSLDTFFSFYIGKVVRDQRSREISISNNFKDKNQKAIDNINNIENQKIDMGGSNSDNIDVPLD